MLGSAKIAASSAYSEHLKFAALGNTGCRIPCCAAASMIRCSGSMASMNNKGERGSPYLNPPTCLISLVCCPFIRTFEEDVPTIAAIQSLYLVLNPKVSRTSYRKLQFIESNAFEMSSFTRRAGFFFLWRSWITLCA